MIDCQCLSTFFISKLCCLFTSYFVGASASSKTVVLPLSIPLARVKVGAELVEYDGEGLLKWRGAVAIG